MSETTIEWADYTFNPWIGCTKVSEACRHCYAERYGKRFGVEWGPGKPRRPTSGSTWSKPLAWERKAKRELAAVARCSGCGYLSDDPRSLSGCKGRCQDPSGASCNAWPCPGCRRAHYWCGSFTRAERPRVFAASLADWLDPEVPAGWLADFLGLIAATPHLDWLLLTKRPELWRERMQLASNLGEQGFHEGAALAGDWLLYQDEPELVELPPNVWVGVTVETQADANARIPALDKIPARVRLASCEPLLEKVHMPRRVRLARDVRGDWPIGHGTVARAGTYVARSNQHGALSVLAEGGELMGIKPGEFEDLGPAVDWIIAGGESGAGARPTHPDWIRGLRDQIAGFGAFLFKQWGEWAPVRMDWQHYKPSLSGRIVELVTAASTSKREVGKRSTWAVCGDPFDPTALVDGEAWELKRVGKKKAGRELDGRTWDEFPIPREAVAS